MNTLRKLFATAVLGVATFAYSTVGRADDCELYCADWACDVCGNCNSECFFNRLSECRNLHCT